MVRLWLLLALSLGTGCSLVTTQEIPLVMLAEVPVPASARWTDDEEEEIGGDAGGGFLFLNNQADPTEGLFETLETDEVEAAEAGTLYYEGNEVRTYFGLLIFFIESVTFDGRVVRLKKQPPPPAIGVEDPETAVLDAPAPRTPVAPVEPESEVVESEPVEPAIDPADEPSAAPVVDEPPPDDEPVIKRKKRKKKKKRKKRKKKRKKK